MKISNQGVGPDQNRPVNFRRWREKTLNGGCCKMSKDQINDKAKDGCPEMWNLISRWLRKML
jgi:hypothetical protein